jgi:hypothetical protein
VYVDYEMTGSANGAWVTLETRMQVQFHRTGILFSVRGYKKLWKGWKAKGLLRWNFSTETIG